MQLITATEVTLLSNITASAVTIADGDYIDIALDNITMITNNYFTSEDLCLQDLMEFDGSALTIIANNSFEERGLASGDDIYIYGSYRNDGYYSVESVDDKTITLISGSTIVEELSGASILVSTVLWPKGSGLKKIVADMIAYDYDVRPSKSPNLRSRSLGPLSETYNDDESAFGYPKSIIDRLMRYYVLKVI